MKGCEAMKEILLSERDASRESMSIFSMITIIDDFLFNIRPDVLAKIIKYPEQIYRIQAMKTGKLHPRL
jgi:hypothetical protein